MLGGEVFTKEVTFDREDNRSFLGRNSRLSGKSLKEEPAWCVRKWEIVWCGGILRYVGRVSEEEVEKVGGVRGKSPELHA